MKCALCSFVSETQSLCKSHIITEHPGWKKEISKDAVDINSSPHTYRTWLPDLTANFYNIVIAKCSEKCKDAVQLNKDIEVEFEQWLIESSHFSDQNPREWNEIFDQIFNTTIEHLEIVFGGVSVPSELLILGFTVESLYSIRALWCSWNNFHFGLYLPCYVPPD